VASLTRLVNLVELQKAAQLAEVQRIKLQFEYQTLAERAASDFVMTKRMSIGRSVIAANERAQRYPNGAAC
jgi:hypothetical protein